ncbi:unnamed protein product [Dicrocoelium dendriticum]|nr:unnamed protein product [Dicrocoelium dendriticum]
MVVVHSGKKKRATLRGAFSHEGIHEFLWSILVGDTKVPLFPVQTMPTIEKVDGWDGQDAPPIEEEEVDLADLGIKVDL